MTVSAECVRWKKKIVEPRARYLLARDGLNAVTHAANLTRLEVFFFFYSFLRQAK